jgi:hypothetical protein
MRLNSKVTWGLAWTGLAVVLAVPSVDFLTGRMSAGDAAVLTSDVEPVKTASTVTTIKTENGIRIVPAGGKLPEAEPKKVVTSSKALPDYISDDTPAAETQVASIDPTPPTPFPSWARPKLDATAPAAATVASPAAPELTTAPIAPTLTTPAVTPEPIVIVDDPVVTGSVAAPTRPVPPDPIVDDSANWDTETLRDYLERRGILEGGDERSTATVTERSTTYDPDGFYLDEGPNPGRSMRETRRERLERLFEESGDDPDSLTLF